MMKKIIYHAFLLFLVNINLVAAQEIKHCNATIAFPDESPIINDIRIIKNGNQNIAKIIQTVDTNSTTSEEDVVISRHKINHDLTGLTEGNDYNPNQFNKGESYIMLAMNLENFPPMDGVEMGPSPFRTGIDLKLVKSVTLYQIGQESSFGAVVLVEAYDQDNKALGTYLQALAVAPCK
jgi:hypothetical protein